ncbi:MAG TPA: MazG nucleotide pyrophosphohydrolase domain-containing protein [Candidatus Paceibacterota bacterium]|nr:MazG nucleotide pyrophosphohydrolase domain-containing protein [Candidatus Paceibacterota bacterium]
MNSLQKQVADFMNEMGWQYFDDERLIAKIKEELKEVEDELKTDNTLEAEMEYGDLLFAVFCLANAKNINPEVALERAIQKFRTRDKDRYPEGK